MYSNVFPNIERIHDYLPNKFNMPKVEIGMFILFD